MYPYLCAAIVGLPALGTAAEKDTLPPLVDGKAPQTHEEAWSGFDPRKEPLDVEVLKEWEQDGVALQVLRYRIGVFKGQKAMMIGVYGYPKDAMEKGEKIPGLVQIHGGGQYAHEAAVLTNAKRGYATISISWAGRISAKGYFVNPNVVKLFWEGKTDNPQYKLTTDWGALDAYHAPSRHGKDAFVAIRKGEEDWTLDSVESPRNSSWFLCALGARRALTFLEQQPVVDPERLGVYGHSMGGKLTVLTTGADSRVKASAPSCGGVSDYANENPLHRNVVGDSTSLQKIDCPILFLKPANDFHGRINDVPKAVDDIQTKEWRVTSSPHHNHQDTPEYEVATQLWFDEHLKGSFKFPETPGFKVDLSKGVPKAFVQVDASRPVQSVEVFYTQQGKNPGAKLDIDNVKNRHWRYAKTSNKGSFWEAEMPLISSDKPLWAYANVTYGLDEPVTIAGYYYAVRSADKFVLSSLLSMTAPAQLQEAEVKATLKPSNMIEDFSEGWQKEWFSYKPGWGRSTHKVYDPQWKAPEGAKLALQVSCKEKNALVITIDGYATEVALEGGNSWEAIELPASAFKNQADEALASFQGIKELRLSPTEVLRGKPENKTLGKEWVGPDPVFNDLHWVPGKPAAKQSTANKGGWSQAQPDTTWTYKTVDGNDFTLSVFLPEGYAESDEVYPTFVVYHGGSWRTGEPNWHYPDCAYWRDRGMVAVSVKYRLQKRDNVEVPLECVKDAKSAIRYLRKNAAKLKIDTNKIVAAGGSAGGQMAAAVATLDDPSTNDAVYDTSISCVPNAVILYNPYFRCKAELSPPNFVRSGLPPFITFLGDQDPAIPVKDLLAFHEKLKASGGASEYYVGKDGKHGLCNGRNPRNPYFYWSLNLEDQFLVKHGILTGSSLVAVPQGVKTMVDGKDYQSYK